MGGFGEGSRAFRIFARLRAYGGLKGEKTSYAKQRPPIISHCTSIYISMCIRMYIYIYMSTFVFRTCGEVGVWGLGF